MVGRRPIGRGRDTARINKRYVQRAEISRLLAEYTPIGDTPSERNAARTAYIENLLRTDTPSTEDEIAAILSDLASYPGWEMVPGNIHPDRREV